MSRILRVNKKELNNIICEAVKIVLAEDGGHFLYGINPEGRSDIGYEQSIEGADLQINNAGTIHIDKCTKAGNVYTAVDSNDHRISIPVDSVKELLDGKSINAELEDGDITYDVYVSIAHSNEFNKTQQYLDDIATDQVRPIFGSSKMGN